MKYRKAALLALAVLSLLALAVFTPFEQYVVALQAWTQENPTTALFAVGAFFAFTVIGLLKYIQSNNGLDDRGHEELQASIHRIERSYFDARAEDQPDLHEIAETWVRRTSNSSAQPPS